MVWPSTVATGCFGLVSAFCAEPAVAQAMQRSDNSAILKGAESIAQVYPRAERKNRSRKCGVPEPPAAIRAQKSRRRRPCFSHDDGLDKKGRGGRHSEPALPD